MVKRKERPSDASPPPARASKKAKESKDETPVTLEIKRNYPKLFGEVMNDPKKRVELFEKVKAEENRYRELYAQERDSQELGDPHALLLDPHASQNIFKFIEESPEEQAIPRIYANHQRNTTEAVIVDKKEFLLNFELFTESQFRYLDWSNIIVAGGSVLGCLLPTGDAKTPKEKRAYFHKDAYKNSDIDIFIYGLNAEQANEKMNAIYETVCNSIPGAEDVIAFRSQHAVTIISLFPYRHIQIVLRLYKSPAEVLMGFDIDACAVGFDGENVWMSPRAHHAIVYQANTVDMTRRSPSYEMRLSKYATRGFSILVPSLDESKIDPQIFEKRFDQVQGLAKLILLTKVEAPEIRFSYKQQLRLKKLRPEAKNTSKFYDLLSSDIGDGEDDEYNAERLSGASASDYSTVFLPWGPKWTATKVRKLMYTKDMILNSKWYDPTKKFHTHPCFFGTIKEIIGDCCGNCPPIPEEDIDPDTPYVSGEITWLDVNPGQQNQLQRIGSFHPITEGDWTEGAFISHENEELSAAVNSNNVELTKKLLESNTLDISKKDSSGRTALHIACFARSIECALLLIEKGAKITPMTDGRTPLHICAQYGIKELILPLINRIAFVIKDNERKRIEEEENKKKKKKSKKSKKKKSKRRGGEEDGEGGEDEEMGDEGEEGGEDEEEGEDEEGEEEGEDDEEGEGGEDEDGDDEVDPDSCIKKQLEEKKKAQEAEEEEEEDKNEEVLDINAPEWDYQFSPLQLAVFFGRVEVVEALLKNGGDALSLKDGESMGTMALDSRNSTELIKVLLANGYPVNHLNSSKKTMLHVICESLTIEQLKVVVPYKPDFTLADYQNNAPLDIAIRAKVYEEDQLNELREKNPTSAEEYDKYLTVANFIEFFSYLLENGVDVKKGIFKWVGVLHQQYNQTNSVQLFQFLIEKLQLNVNDIGHSEYCTIKDMLLHDIEGLNVYFNPKAKPIYEKDDLQSTGDYYQRKEEITTNKLISNDVFYSHRLLVLYGPHLRFLLECYQNAKYSYEKLFYRVSIHKLLLKMRKAVPDVKAKEEEREKERKEREEAEAKRRIKNEKRLPKLNAILKIVEGVKGLSYTETPGMVLQNFRYRYGYGHVGSYSAPTRYSGRYVYENHGITFDFQGFGSHVSILAELSEVTRNFFDGIVSSNLERIDQSTLKQEIGKQAHACTSLTLQGGTGNTGNSHYSHSKESYSAIFFPIYNNQPDLLRKLLEIGKQQYTPLESSESQKDKFVPSINNHDLMNLMKKGVKVGDYVTRSGRSEEDDFGAADDEIDDPNKKVEKKLNSIISPSKIVAETGEFGNYLHLAALYDSAEACEVFLDFIRENKLEPVSKLDLEEGEDPTEAFISHLIENGNYRRPMPFILAIMLEHLNVARVLIRYGGVKVVTEEDLPEVYTGLDVGGQKMDWAMEHHHQEAERTSFAIHYAAFSNKPKAIEFLVKEAPGIWREYYKKRFPDRELPNLPEDFQLTAKTKYDMTALHICVLHKKKEEAIKKLLELDDEKLLINAETKAGQTALMIAVYEGRKKYVEILLGHGASLLHKDSRGFTAFHIAIEKNHKKIVEILLKHLDKQQINEPSKQSKFTPLTIGVQRKSTESVKLLLASGLCDRYIKDAGGYFSLHYAAAKDDAEMVALLLDDKDNHRYHEENGVHMTVLDTAIVQALNRKCQETKLIADKLYNTLGLKRELAQYKYVRQVADLIIEQTREKLEREREKKKKNKYYSPKREKLTEDLEPTKNHTDPLPKTSEGVPLIPLKDLLVVESVNFDAEIETFNQVAKAILAPIYND